MTLRYWDTTNRLKTGAKVNFFKVGMQNCGKLRLIGMKFAGFDYHLMVYDDKLIFAVLILINNLMTKK